MRNGTRIQCVVRLSAGLILVLGLAGCGGSSGGDSSGGDDLADTLAPPAAQTVVGIVDAGAEAPLLAAVSHPIKLRRA